MYTRRGIEATPLVIGQATNVAMVFVDTLFAGRLSSEDLAAVPPRPRT